MKLITSLICFFLPLICNAIDPGHTIVEDLNDLEIKTRSFNSVKKRKIILNNGLHVLVISDKNASSSACSLCVEVGSWQDPDGYAGMAHFVEHLLFMGSKKFPQENAFDQYILDNSGSFNAYTASDKTVYMFKTSNESFFGGLDIFSQFFISPLFSEAGISRELNAVDQEHNKNLEHEGWREFMVLKETANKEHPFHKFSTGTAKTLNLIPRDNLIKWYETHYSSKQMHLVLYSNKSISKQIEEVTRLFSAVPVRNPPTETLPEIFDKTQKGNLIVIEPLINEKKLSLIFELPQEIAKDVYTHSDGFLSYVLKNTGKDTLFDQLKKLQYIHSLDASSSRFSRDSKLFAVEFELTQKGLKEYKHVIELFFSALNCYESQSISPYIFNEYKNLKNIDYTYQSKQDSISYVSSLAAAMPYENFKTFPMLQSTVSQYKPLMIKNLLYFLKKENCVFVLKSPKSETSFNTNKKEQYIGASYCVNNLEIDKKNLNLKIKTAAPNPFMPTDFSLSSKDSSSLDDPKQMLKNPSIISYFAQDKLFKSPKAYFQATIYSDVCVNTAKSQALLDLFVHLSYFCTDHIQTSAQMAGLHANIDSKNSALDINLYGFYQHMPLFLESLLSCINNMKADPSTFKNVVDNLKTQYQEKANGLNILKAKERFITYQNKTADIKALLKALDIITLEEFNTFSKNIFKKTKIQCLSTGAISQEFSLKLSDCLKKECQKEILSEIEISKITFNPINAKDGPYFIPIESDQLANATFLSIQDSRPFNLENKAYMLVLENIVKESFFTELRTNQQTGYIVGTGAFEKDLHQFLCFYVHSSSHQAQDLLSRFDLFFEERLKAFKTEVSESRFLHIKEQITSLLKKPHDSLYNHSKELYSHLFELKDLQRKNKLIQALSEISYEGFESFTFELLSKKNTARLAVLCTGAETGEKTFKYKKCNTP